MLLKFSDSKEKPSTRAKHGAGPVPYRNEVSGTGIFWTSHSKRKMRQYRLSEKRVLRVLRKPERSEEGIAPGTVAAMQITGTKKHPTEVWLMYEALNKPKKIKIISTWRYPGRTPLNERPHIPEDIIRELNLSIN